MSQTTIKILRGISYALVAALGIVVGYWNGVSDTYQAAEKALCNAENGMYVVTKTERLCLSRRIMVPARQHLQSSLYL